jgi:CheY-like chemotaxis protein
MAKTILLAEDEKDVALVTATPLMKMGYDVVIAADGEEAFTLIRKHRPDLILLDYLMPVIDGEEVSRRIRKDEQLKDIPIIIITASQAKHFSHFLEESKINDFLIKPFQIEDLINKIKKIIG